MKVQFIDQSFLLNAFSLGGKSIEKFYSTILVDDKFKEKVLVFVMVKGIKKSSNNKYEVII